MKDMLTFDLGITQELLTDGLDAGVNMVPEFGMDLTIVGEVHCGPDICALDLIAATCINEP